MSLKPVGKKRLMLLMMLLVNGGLLTFRRVDRSLIPPDPTSALATEQSAAWVDERIARHALRPTEELRDAPLWYAQAEPALRAARTHRRLLFVLATHGDVFSGRI